MPGGSPVLRQVSLEILAMAEARPLSSSVFILFLWVGAAVSFRYHLPKANA